jgi:hypothetical protein
LLLLPSRQLLSVKLIWTFMQSYKSMINYIPISKPPNSLIMGCFITIIYLWCTALLQFILEESEAFAAIDASRRGGLGIVVR